MTIEVHDDFLDQEDFERISTLINSAEFYWTRSPILNKFTYPKNIPSKILCEEKYNHQFVHFLYAEYKPRSRFADDILTQFIKQLSPRSILRAKVNFNPCTENIIEHAFHHDYEPDEYPDMKTALFYINDNDGYTLFEDRTKIETIKNRCVIMKENILHTGTNCTNDHGRIVLAINYL